MLENFLFTPLETQETITELPRLLWAIPKKKGDIILCVCQNKSYLRVPAGAEIMKEDVLFPLTHCSREKKHYGKQSGSSRWMCGS